MICACDSHSSPETLRSQRAFSTRRLAAPLSGGPSFSAASSSAFALAAAAAFSAASAAASFSGGSSSSSSSSESITSACAARFREIEGD